MCVGNTSAQQNLCQIHTQSKCQLWRNNQPSLWFFLFFCIWLSCPFYPLSRQSLAQKTQTTKEMKRRMNSLLSADSVRPKKTRGSTLDSFQDNEHIFIGFFLLFFSVILASMTCAFCESCCCFCCCCFYSLSSELLLWIIVLLFPDFGITSPQISWSH